MPKKSVELVVDDEAVSPFVETDVETQGEALDFELELISEPEEEAATEPEPEPEPEPAQLPDAVLVFNAAVAPLWLSKGYLRVSNRYKSIRFDAKELPKKHVSFLLSLAVRALRSRGTIYVPVYLSDSEQLAGLEDRGNVGLFAAFYKP